MKLNFNWRRFFCCPSPRAYGRRQRPPVASTSSSTKSSSPMTNAAAHQGSSCDEASIVTAPVDLALTALPTSIGHYTIAERSELPISQPPDARGINTLATNAPIQEIAVVLSSVSACGGWREPREELRVHAGRSGVVEMLEQHTVSPTSNSILREVDPKMIPTEGAKEASSPAEMMSSQYASLPIHENPIHNIGATQSVHNNSTAQSTSPSCVSDAGPGIDRTTVKLTMEDISISQNVVDSSIHALQNHNVNLNEEDTSSWSTSADEGPDEGISLTQADIHGAGYPSPTGGQALVIGSSSEESIAESEESLFVDGDVGAIFFPQPQPASMYLDYSERELVRDFGEDICEAIDSATGEVLGYGTYQPFSRTTAEDEVAATINITLPSNPQRHRRRKWRPSIPTELGRYVGARYNETQTYLKDLLWAKQGELLERMTFQINGIVAKRRMGGVVQSHAQASRPLLDPECTRLIVGLILGILGRTESKKEGKGKSKMEDESSDSEGEGVYLVDEVEWEARFPDYFSIPVT